MKSDMRDVVSITETQKSSLVLIIHNVRSAYNVGSLFRTADGAGVDCIFLTGYTPTPSKKDMIYMTKAEKELSKTALGAEKNILWKKKKSFGSVREMLHQDGYEVIALEQSLRSMDYRAYTPEKKKIALVVGNEVSGVDEKILRQCDQILEIPMYGEKNSLNVSVAGGIALYSIVSILEE